MTDLREALIAHCRSLSACGLMKGSAGNLSVREGDGYLITPTGMACADLEATDLVFTALGENRAPEAANTRRPSSEWRMHADIYRSRPEAGAIVHAHSPFATSLACLRADIPAFHYMIARFGGATLRCAAYATFGTPELSAAALLALRERKACLLANHGMLVFGSDLAEALALAIELETLCEHYWRARQLGEPALLDGAEMAIVLEKFASYGQQGDAP